MSNSPANLTPSSRDWLYALFKGGLSAIPGAGGLAAEFFSLIVKPPVLKKQDRLITEILAELEQLRGQYLSFDPNTLVDNEAFAAAVLTLMNTAMRTSDEEKLRAVKNAILNTAIAPDRDAHLRETLQYLVDRLTSAHLRTLLLLVPYLAGCGKSAEFGKERLAS